MKCTLGLEIQTLLRTQLCVAEHQSHVYFEGMMLMVVFVTVWIQVQIAQIFEGTQPQHAKTKQKILHRIKEMDK